MPGNGHVPFGKGPSEKDPNHGHLAGGLLHPTSEGWLYLATVIDLCTREVVGWSMAQHMRASMVIDAVRMAHAAGRVEGNAIFHSDRGSQGGFNWSSQHVATPARESRPPDTIRIRLPSASPPRCEEAAAKVSHLHSNQQRLTAHTGSPPEP